MKRKTFEDILKEIRRQNHNWEILESLCTLYPSVSAHTLGSIISQDYQRKTTKLHARKTCAEMVDYYCHRVEDHLNETDKWKPGFLVSLAHEVDVSPSLLARLILENYRSKTPDRKNWPNLQAILKDPSQIEDPRLAIEVQLCVLADKSYGPIADAIKQSTGYEHENNLKQKLTELGIPFQDEDQLRQMGYDKTPDVKLEIPFAVNGHVVNWIESKALFGDDVYHKEYARRQYLSYWNRFGPGLVIYWFDFIEDLNTDADKILVMDRLPVEGMIRMNPTVVPPS